MAIAAAGIVKPAYKAGETWRLFTGAFLHGNILHLGMNLSALWYLGRTRRNPRPLAPPRQRLFPLHRRRRMGHYRMGHHQFRGHLRSGLRTPRISPRFSKPFIARSSPLPARRRMFGILVSLIVIGFVGFRFIDNAAHCGGLLTGAAYAAIVFPKSAALSRPHILKQDRLMGRSFRRLSGLLRACRNRDHADTLASRRDAP